MQTFDVTINEISKIEGKASLSVKVENDVVTECKFCITEFKRFYTQALKDKDVLGLPQLACRICGTCSNAHLLCAIKAAEQALAIVPSEQTLRLRELLNFGLNIRDHALHCYVFALPDILGVDSILSLDENNPEYQQLLADTFEVKAAGNELSKIIGGKSVHAPFPMVGGFAKLPDPKTFPGVIEKLEHARPAVLRLISIFNTCDFELLQDIEYVSYIDDRYSFLTGELVKSNGEVIPAKDMGDYLQHVDIPYSQASGYTFNGKVHMTGALARLNIAKDHLHKRTQEDAKEAISKFPSKNIYHNNLAQTIEILHAIDTSVDLLKSIQLTPERPQLIKRQAGTGIGVVEAPRGMLFYKISIDEKGIIKDVQIVVPTGQNQIGIEIGLKDYFQKHLDRGKDQLSLDAERIVRAYDPCMSCASHFLKINWQEYR